MSPSLDISFEQIDQPDAADPVERLTWGKLGIRVRGRIATRVRDNVLDEERSELFVPTFEIADWIVRNWWAILNEPARFDSIYPPGSAQWDNPKFFWWAKRHCLRASDSSLLLPALYIFNDGRDVALHWYADDLTREAQFEGSGADRLSCAEVADALEGFVDRVLDCVRDANDLRVAETVELWSYIRSADPDVADFCVAAGRMGLDPHDPSSVDDELARLIEEYVKEPNLPLIRDLTEAADPAILEQQLRWVWGIDSVMRLGRRPSSVDVGISAPESVPPYEVGVRAARALRARISMHEDEPVDSVEDTAARIMGRPLIRDLRNSLPDGAIRAEVGWSRDNEAIVIGPDRHPHADRFLAARGLYHALFACERSQRLITEAFTWDQRASRAFAAELLAPQGALVAEVGHYADSGDLNNLAARYNVSDYVVMHQLTNAGVPVTGE